MSKRIDVRAILEAYFNLGKDAYMRGKRTLFYRIRDMFLDYDI